MAKYDLIALIDGDEAIYKVAFTCQKTVYHVCHMETEAIRTFGTNKEAIEFIGNDDNEELTIIKCTAPIASERVAKKRISMWINTVVQDTEATAAVVYLSGDENFRYDIATIKPYKGGRDGANRPIYYQLLRDYLVERHYAQVQYGIECDDALSIYQRQFNAAGQDTILCCQDKDLDMVPGKHYNPTRRECYDLTEEEAWKNFYKQLLTGDYVDNIPGIIGVGPVTANKLISPCRTPTEAYQVVYERYSKAKAYAGMNIHKVLLELGRLLWMLTAHNDMWNPPRYYSRRIYV